MQITVQLRADIARSLTQRSPPSAEADALRRTLQALGVTLEPLHPGADDPNLSPYFVVPVPDQPSAERVLAQLQQHQAVEAAYLKPPDAMP